MAKLKPIYVYAPESLCNQMNKLYCEAQARVRQGSARDGPLGERPQSFNPCLELTLKVGCHPPTHPEVSLHLTNGLMMGR